MGLGRNNDHQRTVVMKFEPQNLTLELDFANILREVASNHNVMIKKNTNFPEVQP